MSPSSLKSTQAELAKKIAWCQAKFSPSSGSRADPPALVVIHRHGTELDPDFSYCSGNEEPHMGFGHLGFVVDDVPGLVKRVEEAGELR